MGVLGGIVTWLTAVPNWACSGGGAHARRGATATAAKMHARCEISRA
jgi:hypothetical protein